MYSTCSHYNVIPRNKATSLFSIQIHVHTILFNTRIKTCSAYFPVFDFCCFYRVFLCNPFGRATDYMVNTLAYFLHTFYTVRSLLIRQWGVTDDQFPMFVQELHILGFPLVFSNQFSPINVMFPSHLLCLSSLLLSIFFS